MIAERKETKNVFGLIVKSIMFFPLIYSFVFSEQFGFLTSERVSLIILCVYAFFFCHKRMEQSIAKCNIHGMYIFQFALLIYLALVLLIIGKGTGTNILPFIVFFLTIVPLELYCLINLFDSNDELMQVLFLVSVFQSLVIVGTLISPSFASLIDNTFNSVNEYFDARFMRLNGYPGGISCVTSTGALKLSLGVISGMYLFQKSKGKFIYLALTFFIMTISIMVARTSLFIGMVAIILFILTSVLRNESVFVVFRRILAISIVCFVVYHFFAANGQTFFVRLIRLQELGLNNGFFNSYFHGKTTIIPELSWKTIIGTGIVSGESGNGVIINADGNFTRMYCALGAPLAILFYLFLFYKMIISAFFTRSNPTVCYTAFLMFSIMIIGEFKEPFFYTRYMFILFYLVVYFYEKENISTHIQYRDYVSLYQENALLKMLKKGGNV